MKAWQGRNDAVTTNGGSGGGGGGWLKNVTFRNFKLENVGQPISITECVYGNTPQLCDTSQVSIFALS